MPAFSYKSWEGRRLALPASPLGCTGDCPDPKIPDLLLVSRQLSSKDVKNWSKTHGESFRQARRVCPSAARTLVVFGDRAPVLYQNSSAASISTVFPA